MGAIPTESATIRKEISLGHFFFNLNLLGLYLQNGFKIHISFVTRYLSYVKYDDSLGIAPTRNCTHFIKIGFLVAGLGFYSFNIHQGNKSDKAG
jgi:hypothetical protein